ncbi:uncharacterized protein LAESUDRAFT_727693 [Laetiporus sulphureus 93-53]|uniref:Uncharacterized protein n=1 Tax=Laetiporus sulphureus 93-53 TaxID=1314785 RepID=A0A165DGH0_9APHY|nr:uncharacterized protein LAESUDRAFT_727693 [Laetiporus sulphureus 93-53]KZT04834.1 hypothetical protein LAESUDRAFT_727693 [Laetiporus sulphureus 93-53]
MPNAVGIAIGVSIGFIAVLTIVSGIVLHRRRRNPHVIASEPRKEVRRSTILELSHPACRVTPFGSPEEDTPRFMHTPGANMRVAHRRSDGGWEFTEIQPDSASMLDFSPSRVSLSAHSTFSFPSKDKLKLKPGELTTQGYVERELDVDVEENPPPAYSQTEESFLSHVA